MERINSQESAPQLKFEITERYKHFIPEEFSQDPFLYFEQRGKNIKSGETLYNVSGKVSEDPSAVKDLPEWGDGEGRALTTVGKRINTEKGKISDSSDPFYEAMIIDVAKKYDLPTAEVVAKVSRGNDHLMVMEKIPGIRWSDIPLLIESGYSAEDLEQLRLDAEARMEELKARFEAVGIKRKWHLKDMVINLDIENKKIRSMIPVDWERTKLEDPNKLETTRLVQSIRARIEGLRSELLEEDIQKIEKAITLGVGLHQDQQPRPDGPYVNHILRGVERALTYLEIRDPDIISSIALHDSVEDQAGKLADRLPETPEKLGIRDKAFKYIAQEFGQKVADLVFGVTNPEKLKTMDREESAKAYVAHVAEVIEDPKEFLVKLCDFMDNGLGLQKVADHQKQAKLAAKYLPLYGLFVERIQREDISLPEEKRVEIISRIREEETFARSVLGSA